MLVLWLIDLFFVVLVADSVVVVVVVADSVVGSILHVVECIQFDLVLLLVADTVVRNMVEAQQEVL